LPILHNESYIRIAYDPEKFWLYADWSGCQTVGSVQSGCERIGELMGEYKAYRILNDNTHVLALYGGAASGAVEKSA
jgi:hypothetical protein